MIDNPVHFDDGNWWFWNETWTDRYGPYETEQEAIKMCKDYAYYLEGCDFEQKRNDVI